MIGLWVLLAGLVLGIAVGLIASWPARVLLLPLIALVGAYLIAPESSRGASAATAGNTSAAGGLRGFLRSSARWRSSHG